MSCRVESCEELVHKNGRCLTHHRQYSAEKMREWRLKNPEKVKENDRRYRQNNPEAAYASQLKWRLNNQEHLRELHQSYAKKNWESRYANKHRHQARSRGREVDLVLRKEIKRMYHSPCVYCGAKERITLDHLIPLSRGGNHTIGNLAPACRSCNARKGTKLPIEFKVWRKKVMSLINQ